MQLFRLSTSTPGLADIHTYMDVMQTARHAGRRACMHSSIVMQSLQTAPILTFAVKVYGVESDRIDSSDSVQKTEQTQCSIDMRYHRHHPGPDGFGVISDIDDTVKAEVAFAVLYSRCSLRPARL